MAVLIQITAPKLLCDLARYRDVVLERFSNPYIQGTDQQRRCRSAFPISCIPPTLAECFERCVDPADAFCSESLLWGRMAYKPALLKVMRAALEYVDAWLAERVRT